MNPVLDLIHNYRQQTERKEDDPKEGEDEEPDDQGAKVIFAGFIFADEGPDDDHDDADARQGHHQEGEQPEPYGNVIFIFAAVGHKGLGDQDFSKFTPMQPLCYVRKEVGMLLELPLRHQKKTNCVNGFPIKSGKINSVL